MEVNPDEKKNILEALIYKMYSMPFSIPNFGLGIQNKVSTKQYQSEFIQSEVDRLVQLFTSRGS